jgi:hypothetical protein
MRLRRFGVAIVQLAAEVLAFGFGTCLPVLAVAWTVDHFPDPYRPTFDTWWMWFPVVPGTFVLVALLPFPWHRRPSFVAAAAFAVSLSIVGWISWRVRYAYFFEPPDARQHLPSELFSLRNLSFAALACGAALAGRRVARRGRVSE